MAGPQGSLACRPQRPPRASACPAQRAAGCRAAAAPAPGRRPNHRPRRRAGAPAGACVSGRPAALPACTCRPPRRAPARAPLAAAGAHTAMSGAPQPTRAGWADPAVAAVKLAPGAGPTVNLSAVSATLAGGRASPGAGYSSASSPSYARAAPSSSGHSCPYISRTGSGRTSDEEASAAAAAAGDQAAAALHALSRQGSLAGGAGGGAGGSPPGASTPHPPPARSPLGRSGGPDSSGTDGEGSVQGEPLPPAGCAAARTRAAAARCASANRRQWP